MMTEWNDERSGMEDASLGAAGSIADYARISDALAFIAANWESQPRLDDVAKAAGLSPFHFQRLFSRWVGISPKKFLGLITLERAKSSLEGDASLLDAAFDAGLSGPGRLHDLFVTYEAMTPGDYKRDGTGLVIHWDWCPGPFGETLVLVAPRGLCGLAFLDARGREACFEDMTDRWPGATFIRDPAVVGPVMARIFNPAGKAPEAPQSPLRLFLKGTEFQVKVWEALMRIPPGDVTTYGRLAESMGLPRRAARAVGGAVALNPISWLIPCHRVIRGSGMLGGYRWGLPRKVGMLSAETVGRGISVAVAGNDARSMELSA